MRQMFHCILEIVSRNLQFIRRTHKHWFGSMRITVQQSAIDADQFFNGRLGLCPFHSKRPQRGKRFLQFLLNLFGG